MKVIKKYLPTLHLGMFLTVFLSLFFMCLILQLTQSINWSSFERNAIANGELWRIITAHLTHINWHHFNLNMLGAFFCLILFFNDFNAKHWFYSFLFISIFSSLCMLFIHFDHSRYVGFSDVLYGWMVIGILAIIEKETKTALLLALFLIGKTIYEIVIDASPFGNTQIIVARESHLYGAIGGLIYALVIMKRRPWRLLIGTNTNTL